MSGPVNGAGALRALPAPAAEDDPLIGAIRKLLPERTSEDKALGIVRVHVGASEGAETIRVPVPFHAANAVWQERFKAAGTKLMAELEADESGAAMMALLTGQTALQLELLEAFSPDMLDQAWVADHATDEQILEAFLGVTAAAFPTPVALARVLLANRQVAQWVRLQLIRTLYSGSTASSPPSSATRSRKSTKG